MDNVKEKIRKLLAKATSQNEHEAQAALLKARELMAKHKISEKEVSDAPSANRKVQKKCFCEETYSSKKNAWFPNLAFCVGSNHCCAVISNTVGRRTTHTVQFAGIGDDADIALEIFTYAVHHIKDRVKMERVDINKRYAWQETRNNLVNMFEQGYAEGFVCGLKKQYEEQNHFEEELAIVMVMPQEVNDYTRKMKPSKFKAEDRGSSLSAFEEGYDAGKSFNPVKQLSGKVEAV